jgi:hypothetical protein
MGGAYLGVLDTNSSSIQRCTYLYSCKAGGISVIDLANIIHSFIATRSGQKNQQLFRVLGRFDNSDVEVAGALKK